MSGIGKYLTDLVSIVHVTMARGVRSTTTTSDVPAFITEKTVVIRDEKGDHFGTRHVVFLKGDVALSDFDELVVDDKQRPIADIFKVRTHSNEIHHLEVEVM